MQQKFAQELFPRIKGEISRHAADPNTDGVLFGSPRQVCRRYAITCFANSLPPRESVGAQAVPAGQVETAGTTGGPADSMC